MSERAWYRSIYWRIALGFILFLALILAAQGTLFLWTVARADGALPAHSLLDLANVIASDLGDELDKNAQLDVAKYVREHYGEVSRRVSVLMGDRAFGNHRFPVPGPVRDAAARWLLNGAPAEVETLPLRFSRLIAIARVKSNGAFVGVVAVQPGSPSSRVFQEILPTMIVIGLGLMVGGTALAALLIFRPASRKLKGLEQAARDLGAGHLEARAPVGGGDEIAAVARAFNRMADDLATRAAQLDASDRARRQLLADVSHELMTPLTAIRGYVETLAMPALELDETRRQRYLNVIEEETLRLEAIIGDLLDLARLDAGGGSLKWQTVRLEDLFDRVAARHERVAAEKQVELSAEICPGGDVVDADPDRLEQALQNLAANALRHTPAGGSVALRSMAADDVVVLQVRDSGEGIPREHLPMIFDRFYKVDASRSGADGSGLGLSIVKAIVERHYGTVTAASTPGVETVFEIRLPKIRRTE